MLLNDSSYRDFDDAITIGVSEDDGFYRDVKIPVLDFIRHTLVVGSTGSGKTTTSATIAAQLARYGYVLIVDWNNEYASMLRSLGVEGVLENDVMLPAILGDIDDFIGLLNDVLDLTDAQAYLLYRFLDEVSNVSRITISDLISYIESMPLESKWMAETKAALLRKLKMIYNPKTKYLYSLDGVRLPRSLGNGIHIISLSKLRDVKLRRLAVLTLVGFVERFKELNSSAPNVYIVIDEAHNVVNSTLINRVVAEVRKLGIGFILVTQSPSTMSSSILTNCNIRVIHAMKSYADIELIARSLNIEGLRDILPRLSVGEAVVDAPSFSGAIRVKVAYHHDV